MPTLNLQNYNYIGDIFNVTTNLLLSNRPIGIIYKLLCSSMSTWTILLMHKPVFLF